MAEPSKPVRILVLTVGFLFAAIAGAVTTANTLPKLLEYRRAAQYVPTIATLESWSVETRLRKRKSFHMPVIDYHFLVNGTKYEGDRWAIFGQSVHPDWTPQAAFVGEPPGSAIRIHYDPNDPSRSAVFPALSPNWVSVAGVPFTALVIAIAAAFGLFREWRLHRASR